MSRSISQQLAPGLLVVILLGIAGLAPSSALAADVVVGKWQGTVETQRGANEITLDFKGSDEELQGSWTGPRGTSDLEEEKFQDGVLTFVRNLEVRGNAITLEFRATIEADTMSVTMKTPRAENQFTMTRVK